MKFIILFFLCFCGFVSCQFEDNQKATSGPDSNFEKYIPSVAHFKDLSNVIVNIDVDNTFDYQLFHVEALPFHKKRVRLW